MRDPSFPRPLLATWWILCGVLAGCAGDPADPPRPAVEPAPAAHHGPGAPAAPGTATVSLFDDLGGHHRAITTTSAEAQRFFDQGLRLAYAFNLEEAQRSFEEAARRDPGCASCFWGVALTLGPHINFPAQAERTRAAQRAAESARRVAGRATPVERALIEALAVRYSDPPPADAEGQRRLDQAYADAMREVARRFPYDLDVAALSAEAMMNLRPWDLWTPDGRPQPGIGEILAVLERVLARDPAHPGANHYYIHAVEASPHPEKALGAAERLGGLMPGAAHLVHMPSHVYMRVGRYADAAEANRRAIRADERYLARSPGALDGFYSMYFGHNFQLLWPEGVHDCSPGGASRSRIDSGRQVG